jgi:hypothetical protein
MLQYKAEQLGLKLKEITHADMYNNAERVTFYNALYSNKSQALTKQLSSFHMVSTCALLRHLFATLSAGSLKQNCSLCLFPSGCRCLLCLSTGDDACITSFKANQMVMSSITTPVLSCRLKCHDYGYVNCSVYLQDENGNLSNAPGRSAPLHVAAPKGSLKASAKSRAQPSPTLLLPKGHSRLPPSRVLNPAQSPPQW